MILFNIEAWVTYYENLYKTENNIDVLNFSVILVSIFFTILVTLLNLQDIYAYFDSKAPGGNYNSSDNKNNSKII